MISLFDRSKIFLFTHQTWMMKTKLIQVFILLLINLHKGWKVTKYMYIYWVYNESIVLKSHGKHWINHPHGQPWLVKSTCLLKGSLFSMLSSPSEEPYNTNIIMYSLSWLWYTNCMLSYIMIWLVEFISFLFFTLNIQ